jgi:REP element-mobilizing transposase RayT
MPYDPIIHHRRSIRLQGYDYTRAGAYFVTICTQQRLCLFGEVLNGEMVLNDAGQMVERWWRELNAKFPSVETDEYVIMPNHFHGIVGIHNVGANVRVRAESDDHLESGQSHESAPEESVSLSKVVQWFKTMTTNIYIRGVKDHHWQSFPGKLWQRDYYEHIVRDEKDLKRIRVYIRANPSRWKDDENNPAR